MAILEAYQIFTVLSTDSKLQGIISSEEVTVVGNQSDDNKRGATEMKCKYNLPLAPSKYNTYDGLSSEVKAQLTEDYYNKYSEYLQGIINRYINANKTTVKDFDGGMIVNAYIEAIFAVSKNDKT